MAQSAIKGFRMIYYMIVHEVPQQESHESFLLLRHLHGEKSSNTAQPTPHCVNVVNCHAAEHVRLFQGFYNFSKRVVLSNKKSINQERERMV